MTLNEATILHEWASLHPDATELCATCCSLGPTPHVQLRRRLMKCVLRLCDSVTLSKWLEKIGRDSGGRIGQKRIRIMRFTRYHSLSVVEFSSQTLAYLRQHGTLADVRRVCLELGFPIQGTRQALIRRALRCIHRFERWLPPGDVLSACAVRAVASAYPIQVTGFEAAYCDEFEDEANEVWPGRVHRSYPVANGTSLRIDFHIGTPGADGVGVEFKVPRSNSEIQRAKGQIDQYLAAYPNGRLVLVVIDDGYLSKATLALFERDARSRGVHVVLRRRC